jgi:HrpA-like RNA helicase
MRRILNFSKYLKKFKKLKQLRQNQSNLPVFKYREAILKTVHENQVTIIAGKFKLK